MTNIFATAINVHDNYNFFVTVDTVDFYIRKNCAMLWAVAQRRDNVKSLYKLEDNEYNFTGMEFDTFDEIEEYISNH